MYEFRLQKADTTGKFPSDNTGVLIDTAQSRSIISAATGVPTPPNNLTSLKKLNVNLRDPVSISAANIRNGNVDLTAFIDYSDDIENFLANNPSSQLRIVTYDTVKKTISASTNLSGNGLSVMGITSRTAGISKNNVDTSTNYQVNDNENYIISKNIQIGSIYYLNVINTTSDGNQINSNPLKIDLRYTPNADPLDTLDGVYNGGPLDRKTIGDKSGVVTASVQVPSSYSYDNIWMMTTLYFTANEFSNVNLTRPLESFMNGTGRILYTNYATGSVKPTAVVPSIEELGGGEGYIVFVTNRFDATKKFRDRSDRLVPAIRLDVSAKNGEDKFINGDTQRFNNRELPFSGVRGPVDLSNTGLYWLSGSPDIVNTLYLPSQDKRTAKAYTNDSVNTDHQDFYSAEFLNKNSGIHFLLRDSIKRSLTPILEDNNQKNGLSQDWRDFTNSVRVNSVQYADPIDYQNRGNSAFASVPGALDIDSAMVVKIEGKTSGDLGINRSAGRNILRFNVLLTHIPNNDPDGKALNELTSISIPIDIFATSASTETNTIDYFAAARIPSELILSPTGLLTTGEKIGDNRIVDYNDFYITINDSNNNVVSSSNRIVFGNLSKGALPYQDMNGSLNYQFPDGFQRSSTVEGTLTRTSLSASLTPNHSHTKINENSSVYTDEERILLGIIDKKNRVSSFSSDDKEFNAQAIARNFGNSTIYGNYTIDSDRAIDNMYAITSFNATDKLQNTNFTLPLKKYENNGLFYYNNDTHAVLHYNKYYYTNGKLTNIEARHVNLYGSYNWFKVPTTDTISLQYNVEGSNGDGSYNTLSVKNDADTISNGAPSEYVRYSNVASVTPYIVWPNSDSLISSLESNPNTKISIEYRALDSNSDSKLLSNTINGQTIVKYPVKSLNSKDYRLLLPLNASDKNVTIPVKNNGLYAFNAVATMNYKDSIIDIDFNLGSITSWFEILNDFRTKVHDLSYKLAKIDANISGTTDDKGHYREVSDVTIDTGVNYYTWKNFYTYTVQLEYVNEGGSTQSYTMEPSDNNVNVGDQHYKVVKDDGNVTLTFPLTQPGRYTISVSQSRIYPDGLQSEDGKNISGPDRITNKFDLVERNSTKDDDTGNAGVPGKYVPDDGIRKLDIVYHDSFPQINNGNGQTQFFSSYKNWTSKDTNVLYNDAYFQIDKADGELFGFNNKEKINIINFDGNSYALTPNASMKYPIWKNQTVHLKYYTTGHPNRSINTDGLYSINSKLVSTNGTTMASKVKGRAPKNNAESLPFIHNIDEPTYDSKMLNYRGGRSIIIAGIDSNTVPPKPGIIANSNTRLSPFEVRETTGPTDIPMIAEKDVTFKLGNSNLGYEVEMYIDGVPYTEGTEFTQEGLHVLYVIYRDKHNYKINYSTQKFFIRQSKMHMPPKIDYTPKRRYSDHFDVTINYKFYEHDTVSIDPKGKLYKLNLTDEWKQYTGPIRINKPTTIYARKLFTDGYYLDEELTLNSSVINNNVPDLPTISDLADPKTNEPNNSIFIPVVNMKPGYSYTEYVNGKRWSKFKPITNYNNGQRYFEYKVEVTDNMNGATRTLVKNFMIDTLPPEYPKIQQMPVDNAIYSINPNEKLLISNLDPNVDYSIWVDNKKVDLNKSIKDWNLDNNQKYNRVYKFVVQAKKRSNGMTSTSYFLFDINNDPSTAEMYKTMNDRSQLIPFFRDNDYFQFAHELVIDNRTGDLFITGDDQGENGNYALHPITEPIQDRLKDSGNKIGELFKMINFDGEFIRSLEKSIVNIREANDILYKHRNEIRARIEETSNELYRLELETLASNQATNVLVAKIISQSEMIAGDYTNSQKKLLALTDKVAGIRQNLLNQQKMIMDMNSQIMIDMYNLRSLEKLANNKVTQDKFNSWKANMDKIVNP